MSDVACPPIDPIEELVANPSGDITDSTKVAYQKDLKDFTETFLHFQNPADAVRRLLGCNFETGNALVLEYRQQMVDSTGPKGRDLSSSTINRRLSTLRRIIHAAQRRKLVDWTLDVANVKSESVHNPDGPSLDEMVQIVATIAKDDSPAGRRAYAIIRLMADLGLRRGSVIGLDFGDLRLPKQIRVVLKGREKKKWKDLPKATCVAIQRWLDVHPGRSRRIGPVFVNLIPGRYTRISGPAVYVIVTTASATAGFRTRPHGFRHSAITNAIINAAKLGETLDSVMAFSDHADYRMVLRYRNAANGAQKKFSDSNAQTFGNPFSNDQRSASVHCG